MKNLVLGYFSTPDDKKPEVMRLLAGVLDFNQEEVQKVKINWPFSNSIEILFYQQFFISQIS